MSVNKALVEQLIKLGDCEGARKEILAALRANPKDVDAWLLMAQADEDPAHQKDCYRQVLRIDPTNQAAQDCLRALLAPSPPKEGVKDVVAQPVLDPQTITTQTAPSAQTPAIVSLTCPKCGGKLNITPDMDRFACGYCGTEHIVRRSSGVISLVPVVESIRQVQASTDRVASELAIRRLEEEIKPLQVWIYQAKEVISDRVYQYFLIGGGILIISATGILVLGAIFSQGRGLSTGIVNLVFLGFSFGILSLIIGGCLFTFNWIRNIPIRKRLIINQAYVDSKKKEMEYYWNIINQNSNR